MHLHSVHTSFSQDDCDVLVVSGFAAQGWLNRIYQTAVDADGWVWSNHILDFTRNGHGRAELSKANGEWAIHAPDKAGALIKLAYTTEGVDQEVPPSKASWSVKTKASDGSFLQESIVIGCDQIQGDAVVGITDYPECDVKNPAWVGDGHCDHCEYNTEACGFDGGDCCQETCDEQAHYGCTASTSHCLDPSTDEYRTSTALKFFCTEYNIGDGMCDTENNNELCSFDGGDCCEESCKPSATFNCDKEFFDCKDPDPAGPNVGGQQENTEPGTSDQDSALVAGISAGAIVLIAVAAAAGFVYGRRVGMKSDVESRDDSLDIRVTRDDRFMDIGSDTIEGPTNPIHEKTGSVTNPVKSRTNSNAVTGPRRAASKSAAPPLESPPDSPTDAPSNE
jgi:hypothetical protein